MGRLLVQALWATSWWGLLLLAAAVPVAAVFDQARPLVALVLAVWLSYAVHELGHALLAVALGADEKQVRLVRRGAGLAVVAPHLPPGRTRVVAVGGPLAGILSGVLVVLGVGTLMGLGPVQLVSSLAVVTINHAVNLLPMAPDGRHLFAPARIVDSSRQ